MKFNDLSFVTFFIVLSGIYNHSFITRVNHDDRNFTFLCFYKLGYFYSTLKLQHLR